MIPCPDDSCEGSLHKHTGAVRYYCPLCRRMFDFIVADTPVPNHIPPVEPPPSVEDFLHVVTRRNRLFARGVDDPSRKFMTGRWPKQKGRRR